jgi:hypothetical protein
MYANGLQRQDPQITVPPSERRGRPGARHFARWKQIRSKIIPGGTDYTAATKKNRNKPPVQLNAITRQVAVLSAVFF